jgi:hypothetical protein
MRLRTTFTITAVVMLFFGAGFILSPRLVFGLYGVELDAAGEMLSRVAGSAVFALGTLALYFRSRSKSEQAIIAVRALLTFFILKTIVTLIAQLQGVFNPLGWSIVALDLLLTLAYVYVLTRPTQTIPAS